MPNARPQCVVGKRQTRPKSQVPVPICSPAKTNKLVQERPGSEAWQGDKQIAIIERICAQTLKSEDTSPLSAGRRRASHAAWSCLAAPTASRQFMPAGSGGVSRRAQFEFDTKCRSSASARDVAAAAIPSSRRASLGKSGAHRGAHCWFITVNVQHVVQETCRQREYAESGKETRFPKGMSKWTSRCRVKSASRVSATAWCTSNSDEQRCGCSWFSAVVTPQLHERP